MSQLILENLKNTGFAMLIFVACYVANMAFGLWCNIELLQQKFEISRIWKSVLKIVTFGVGLSLLVIAVTSIPLFCQYVGLELPQQYIEVFTNLAIIAVVLYVSVNYAKEAFDKFKAILNYQPEPKTEDILEIPEDKSVFEDAFQDATEVEDYED